MGSLCQWLLNILTTTLIFTEGYILHHDTATPLHTHSLKFKFHETIIFTTYDTF